MVSVLVIGVYVLLPMLPMSSPTVYSPSAPLDIRKSIYTTTFPGIEPVHSVRTALYEVAVSALQLSSPHHASMAAVAAALPTALDNLRLLTNPFKPGQLGPLEAKLHATVRDAPSALPPSHRHATPTAATGASPIAVVYRADGDPRPSAHTRALVSSVVPLAAAIRHAGVAADVLLLPSQLLALVQTLVQHRCSGKARCRLPGALVEAVEALQTAMEQPLAHQAAISVRTSAFKY
jgi:hypothetical protein